MNLKRIISAGAVTLACTAGAMVATTGTAAADWNECPSGNICIWDLRGGQGEIEIGGTGWEVSGGMTNRASSAWNRTGTQVCLYNGEGRYMRLEPGVQRDIPDWINNSIYNWSPC